MFPRRLNVEGQLQKLLVFRDAFKFALSRFNGFIRNWNEWVALEEKAMAERARGKVLEKEFSEALDFLCYCWKGVVPKSWNNVRTCGYLLLCQLPDNIYYKGYNIKQKYFPPKIVLKLSEDSFEYFGLDSNAVFDGQIVCEVYGKKSVIVDVLCGKISLIQALSFLDNDNAPNYFYAHSKKGEAFDPSMYKNSSVNETTPPFLFVRNFSNFDGINDFEEFLRCFDINRLNYDFYLSERKQNEEEKEQEQKILSSTFSVKRERTSSFSPNSHGARASSPIEWVEKLKEAKAEIQKRIHNVAPKQHSSSNAFDDEGGEELPELKK